MRWGEKIAICVLLLTPVVGLAGWRHGSKQVDPCPVAREYVEVPDCASFTVKGRSYVRSDWTRDIFRGHGLKAGFRTLAWTRVNGLGWVYLDRSGRVVVSHVAPLDNGASPFHEGLVRVVRDGKWALVNGKGRAATRTEYDGILEYNHNRWLACTGCVTKQVGEYGVFDGGHWVALGSNGKAIRGLEGTYAELNR